MKKSFYRSVVIAILICSLIFGFLAFYSTGVVDRAQTRELLDIRINQVGDILDDNSYGNDAFKKQIHYD